jgi:hypothetical protein
VGTASVAVTTNEGLLHYRKTMITIILVNIEDKIIHLIIFLERKSDEFMQHFSPKKHFVTV